MSRLNWMPVYIDRLMADRNVLFMDAETFGAYMLLLFSEWTDGPLPDDINMICKIAKDIDQSKAEALLKQCFRKDKLGFVNDTLEEIKTTQQDLHQKRVDAGAKGGKSKAQKKIQKPSKAKAELEPSSSNKEVEVEEEIDSSSTTTTPSISEVQEHFKMSGYKSDPETFHAFNESRGWKGIESWTAAAVLWEKREKKSDKAPAEAEEWIDFVGTCSACGYTAKARNHISRPHQKLDCQKCCLEGRDPSEIVLKNPNE